MDQADGVRAEEGVGAANTPSFMRWRRVGESNEETRER